MRASDRDTHAFLVGQVESDESRAMLYAMRACTSDACCQGRKPCPTPNACVLPEPGPMFDKSPLASVAIACALTIGAAAVGWILAVPFISPVIVALLERLA
jgi:hypothetical protein